MSDENDAASRTEEPSPRKLQQARERGEVVKTPDLAALASLSAAAAVVAMGGGWLSRNLTTTLTPFLASPDSMSFDNNGGVQIMRAAVTAAAPAIGAVILTVLFGKLSDSLLTEESARSGGRRRLGALLMLRIFGFDFSLIASPSTTNWP